MKRSALIAVLALSLAAPAVASAQGGPGFLFKRPRVTVTVRAGYSLPTTGGQLFDFAVDEFIPLGADTLSTLGFDAPYLGGELAFRPLERWDFTLGVGWTRSRSMTEYRRWIDADGLPIVQETTFEVVYGTVGAKYSLVDRGRQIGRLAWVPQRFTPWVGGGLGISSYDFVQSGDFVDTGTFEIFSDNLETSDEGLILYANAGVDATLFRNAIVTAEARYTYSSADVEYPYEGFNDIDLGGLQLMVGLGFQF
jgi:opacity protein-like surface antigen